MQHNATTNPDLHPDGEASILYSNFLRWFCFLEFIFFAVITAQNQAHPPPGISIRMILCMLCSFFLFLFWFRRSSRPPVFAALLPSGLGQTELPSQNKKQQEKNNTNIFKPHRWKKGPPFFFQLWDEQGIYYRGSHSASTILPRDCSPSGAIFVGKLLSYYTLSLV